MKISNIEYILKINFKMGDIKIRQFENKQFDNIISKNKFRNFQCMIFGKNGTGKSLLVKNLSQLLISECKITNSVFIGNDEHNIVDHKSRFTDTLQIQQFCDKLREDQLPVRDGRLNLLIIIDNTKEHNIDVRERLNYLRPFNRIFCYPDSYFNELDLHKIGLQKSRELLNSDFIFISLLSEIDLDILFDNLFTPFREGERKYGCKYHEDKSIFKKTIDEITKDNTFAVFDTKQLNNISNAAFIEKLSSSIFWYKLQI
jgi:energy-coupling factor transporter ATP-binding protein EcfA2